MERQNQDYSDKIDMWYARDVYRVGKGFLLFWLIGGVAGLALVGLALLGLALSAGPNAPYLSMRAARGVLGITAFSAIGLALLQHDRYWALAGLASGGGLVLVYLCWTL